jgi:hypothetical protein
MRLTNNINWSDFILKVITIVLGICIAFGLENWNESRKNANEETKILSSLAADIVETQNEINYRTKDDSLGLVSIENLLILFDTMKSDNTVVLTRDYFMWVINMSFDPNTTTFESITSSGKIDLIENDEIRSKLFELNATYDKDKISINVWFAEFIAEKIEPILYQHFNVDDIFGKGETTRLNRGSLDQVNIQVLHMCIHKIEGKLWAYDFTKRLNREILELINVELRKND